MPLVVKNKPHMLLHCCCAPCASFVLETLLPDYRITLLFYNPNIEPAVEYKKRQGELIRLVEMMNTDNDARNSLHYQKQPDIIDTEYDNDIFKTAVQFLRDEPEGGERCSVCFELRLKKTAREASAGKYDIFATTLSVSPHKETKVLNDIGTRLSKEFLVEYLPADFKTNDGFKRSVELSKRFNLYRQRFCGCNLNFNDIKSN